MKCDRRHGHIAARWLAVLTYLCILLGARVDGALSPTAGDGREYAITGLSRSDANEDANGEMSVQIGGQWWKQCLGEGLSEARSRGVTATTADDATRAMQTFISVCCQTQCFGIPQGSLHWPGPAPRTGPRSQVAVSTVPVMPHQLLSSWRNIGDLWGNSWGPHWNYPNGITVLYGQVLHPATPGHMLHGEYCFEMFLEGVASLGRLQYQCRCICPTGKGIQVAQGTPMQRWQSAPKRDPSQCSNESSWNNHHYWIWRHTRQQRAYADALWLKPALYKCTHPARAWAYPSRNPDGVYTTYGLDGLRNLMMSHEAPCLNDWPGMSHEARVVCEGFSSRVGAPPDALVTWKHLGIDRLTPNRASCTDKTTDVRSCRNGVVVVKEHAFGRGPHQKPGARCPTDARSCRVGVGGETRYTAIPPREDTSFWRVEDATSRATTESARSSTAGAAYAAEGNLVLPEWNYPIIWLRRRMYVSYTAGYEWKWLKDSGYVWEWLKDMSMSWVLCIIVVVYFTTVYRRSVAQEVVHNVAKTSRRSGRPRNYSQALRDKKIAKAIRRRGLRRKAVHCNDAPRHTTEKRGDKHYDKAGGISTSYLLFKPPRDAYKTRQEMDEHRHGTKLAPPVLARGRRPRVLQPRGIGRTLKFIVYALLWSCGFAARVDQQAVVCYETTGETQPLIQLHRPPGRGGVARANKTVAKFALDMVTVNSTAWGPAQQYLRATTANVVFLQEHKLYGGKLAEASAWADQQGWNSLFNAAKRVTEPGQKEAFSAGVAIFARKGIGLYRDDVESGTPERVLGGVIECPAHPPLQVTSVYFKDGIDMTGLNATLMGQVSTHIQQSHYDGIIGGDFNTDPATTVATGILSDIDGAIIAPGPTCSAGTSWTTIDYFILHGSIDAAVDASRVEKASAIKTHRVVRIVFKECLAELRRQELRKPSRIPTERVFGPLPCPIPCDGILEAAQKAKELAFGAVTYTTPPPSSTHCYNHGEEGPPTPTAAPEPYATFTCSTSYGRALEALGQAFTLFTDHAERELIDITGAEVKKLGTRGKKPKLVKAPLVAKSKPGHQFNCILTSIIDESRWLRDLAIDTAFAVKEQGSGLNLISLHDQLKARETTMSGVQRPEYRVGDDDATVQLGIDAVLIALEEVRQQLAWTLVMAISEIYTNSDQGWSAGLSKEADHALQLARALENQASTVKQGEIHRYWKSSITETGATATKRAFMYTQLPEIVQEQAVLDSLTGVYTAEPTAVLNKAAKALADIWLCGDGPRRSGKKHPWGGGKPLARMTVKVLLEAARTFPNGTCYTFDGIHPRHFALLSYKSLLALSMIYETIECLGVMPEDIQHVMIALLAKPKGGFRPIALLPGVTRLHGRARKHEVDKWEADNPREYLACSKGRGALNAIWKRAMKSEAAVLDNTCVLALLWDLKSFFDTIDLDLLRQRAHQVGFPEALVNIAIATYECPRHIQTRQGVAQPVDPSRGILPGCSFAKALIGVYYMPVLDEFCRLHPGVDVSVYIDDITLSVSGLSDQEAEDLIVKAAHNLNYIIKHKLKGAVAMEKAAVVSSSQAVADSVRNRLGDLAGKSVLTTPDLGVDFSAGRKRGRGAGPVRKKRLQTATKKKVKLRTLRELVGPRVSRQVCGGGVLAGPAYGAEINGFSDKELLTVQRICGAATASCASGRSLTATLLLHGDQTWKLAVAPALRWQKEIWRASAPAVAIGKFTRPAIFNMDELQLYWQTAIKDSYQWYDADGNPKWAATRGPIGATVLSLDRIGWTPTGLDTWKDDRGVELDLKLYSPKLFETMMRNGVQRLAERQLAHKIADPALEGRSACIDPARNYIQQRKRSCKEKSAVATVSTNALWSKDKLIAAGYEVESPMCDMCGQHRDSLHHRLWLCEHPAAVAARRKAATPALIAKAIEAGPESSLYCHSILPHPCDLLPLPSISGANKCAAVHDGAAVTHVEGSVFADGHATRTGIRGMDRASWAMVQVSENCEEQAVFIGAVSAALPQTAQAAEYLGAAYTAYFARAGTKLYDDCKGVVDTFSLNRNLWDNERHAYSGVMRSVLSWDPDQNLAEVIKVKAHVDMVEGLSADEEFCAQGNHLADQWALKAETLHPVDEEAWRVASAAVKEVQMIVETIGAVISLWPYTAKKAKRPKPVKRVKAPKVAIQQRHKWVLGNERWHCTKCRAATRTEHMPTHRRKQRCRGVLDRLAKDHEHNLNHSIVEFTALDGDFSICRKCGAWGMKRALKLATACDNKPLTRRTRQSWDRTFSKGQHPCTGNPFRRAADGNCGVRTVFGAQGTRTNAALKLKRHRLSKKTKPWAAVLSGIATHEASDDMHEFPEDFQEQSQADLLHHDPEQPWDWDEAPHHPQPVVILTSLQVEQIAAKRAATISRKHKRELQIAANKVKAADTKRRKLELNRVKQQEAVHEFRRLNDPFFTDDENEDADMQPEPEVMNINRPGSSTDTYPPAQHGDMPIVALEVPAPTEDCQAEGWLEECLGQIIEEQQRVQPCPDGGEPTPDGTSNDGWLEDCLEQIIDEEELSTPSVDISDVKDAQPQSDAQVRARRAEAASFYGWEMEGAAVQELRSPESQEDTLPEVVPSVTHTSWCATVNCKGNCCVSATQSGSKPRSGERIRQAHSRAVQQASVRHRDIPDGSNGQVLTPAQATLAKMLAKVRAQRHDPSLCTACGHKLSTAECCRS